MFFPVASVVQCTYTVLNLFGERVIYRLKLCFISVKYSVYNLKKGDLFEAICMIPRLSISL